MITNEVLSAYIDGELSPEEMERVRAAIDRDEALAARLRDFSRVDELLAEFSSAIDREPMPARVLELLDPPRTGSETRGTAVQEARILSLPRRPWYRTAGALALAASVVLALAVGLQQESGRDRGAGLDSLVRTGPVPESAALHHALQETASDNAYAAADEAGPSVTPVLSFVSTRGEYCREFRVDAQGQAARGLACRRDDRWEVLRLAAAGAANDGKDAYATAASSVNADFEAFVDALVADAPLGAEAEARLLRDGWRATPR